VLIDEYQDTNNLQYLLASLLAGKWENICVVGDDDQSIYRFRGATIENILSFEQQYKGAKVIRLEQNYRSTGNILAASNEVIRNNLGRKGKELWTQAEDGELVTLYSAVNESDEAQYVTASILKSYSRGNAWKDHAILYRMNAQSNQLEYACKRNGVPYRIIGGTRFFDRAEVKDMLAYLCVLNNPDDDLRLRRIINTPARGIGAKTLDTAQQIAIQEGRPLYQVVSSAGDYPQLGKAAAKLTAFSDMMEELRDQSATMELDKFYQELIARTGYVSTLQAKDSVENRGRIENVQELESSIRGYMENVGEGDTPTLAGFLDEVSLYSDLDSQQDGEDCVVMMTMHSAKGLEFPYVYVVGMEEGIFPGMRSIGEAEEMEEERRLCYVAMTRAKEKLTLTCAAQRMIFGRTSCNRPSRFVGEIPEKLLDQQGNGHQQLRQIREFVADPSDEPGSYQRPQYQRGPGPSAYSRSQSRGPGLKSTSSLGSRPTATSAEVKTYRKGDMVEHQAFGSGMILNLMPMGGDALVEIAFDTVGTKKLMLKTAAQHMRKKS
jgi:DNA helicase-2/ATP-dependent DNA helicase PcrA